MRVQVPVVMGMHFGSTHMDGGSYMIDGIIESMRPYSMIDNHRIGSCTTPSYTTSLNIVE